MYELRYEPLPIEHWDEFLPEFVVTDSALLYVVEREYERHVPGYVSDQSVTDEERRWRELANTCAATIARLLDVLDGVPERFVEPELGRFFDGREVGDG